MNFLYSWGDLELLIPLFHLLSIKSIGVSYYAQLDSILSRGNMSHFYILIYVQSPDKVLFL